MNRALMIDQGVQSFLHHGIRQLKSQLPRGQRRVYGVFNRDTGEVRFANDYSNSFKRSVGDARRFAREQLKMALLGDNEARDAWSVICAAISRDNEVSIERVEAAVSHESEEEFLRSLAAQLSSVLVLSAKEQPSPTPARVALGLPPTREILSGILSTEELEFSRGELVVIPRDRGTLTWGKITERSKDSEGRAQYVVEVEPDEYQTRGAGAIGKLQPEPLSAHAAELIDRCGTEFDLSRARLHADHSFEKGEVVLIHRNDGSYRYAQVFGESPTVSHYLVVVNDERSWKDIPVEEIGKLSFPHPQASRLTEL